MYLHVEYTSNLRNLHNVTWCKFDLGAYLVAYWGIVRCAILQYAPGYGRVTSVTRGNLAYPKLYPKLTRDKYEDSTISSFWDDASFRTNSRTEEY